MKRRYKTGITAMLLLLLCLAAGLSASASSGAKVLRAGRSLRYKKAEYQRITSANPKVLQVSKRGSGFVVTAKQSGTSTLCFYDRQGKLKKKCSVLVLKKSDIRASTSAVRISGGGHVLQKPFQLKIAGSIKPAVKIAYTSSNSKIAYFNKKHNLVTGSKTGTVTLKAVVTYKGVKVRAFQKKVTVGKKDVFDGKTILGLGDSLMCAHFLGKKSSWLNLLGAKHGMKVYNYANTGATVAKRTGNTNSLVTQCSKAIRRLKKVDYIVLLGGANDWRLNVPIGTDSDRTTDTFKGSLYVMLSRLKAAYPKAKIVCMTTYRRHRYKSRLGFQDTDYADAMIQVCRKSGIPCFDNIHDSGVNFASSAWCAWGDEGLYLHMSKNYHFSPAAYQKLVPVYETFLRKAAGRKK